MIKKAMILAAGFGKRLNPVTLNCPKPLLMIGNETLTLIYTPGHLSDSICFWNKDDNIVFTGDTMFVGRPGRVKSPSSNIKQLYHSIYDKLLTLPKNTTVYPGHHYGCFPCITIQKNIELFDFFSCQKFSEFYLVMKNFEKNR